jgi:hypothetical protein
LSGTLRRPSRIGTGALALACVHVVGSCGAANDPARGAPDAGGKTFARLAVVLTAPRDGGVTVGAAGRLLRYRGVDLDSAQVLAGARDRERAPLGRCVLLDGEAQLEDALATSPPDAAVQMLDAGDVLVRVAGQTIKMSPRYVPDIVPFVSGVVYDAEVVSDGIIELGAGSRDEASISAFGGQQVGRFDTAAELPAMPRFVTVAGAAADTSAEIDGGSDLPLTWTADAGSRGTVTLSIGRDAGPALRCRVADTGRFVIPSGPLARIIDAARGETLAVSIKRSRRSPFPAPGIDLAEVEVTARDVVAFHVN